MNRGIKPLIREALRTYMRDSLNGYVEYEDIDQQNVLEQVAVATDMADWELLEDLFFDVVDEEIREYNLNLMVDRQIEVTDKRLANLSKSI